MSKRQKLPPEVMRAIRRENLLKATKRWGSKKVASLRARLAYADLAARQNGGVLGDFSRRGK